MTEGIDRLGYRPNVGIIICNQKNQLLWAKRSDRQAWQFPQGGVNPGEEVEQAMYRELFEEVGLHAEAVALLSRTHRWLYYRLPDPLIRWHEQPVCIGQKQLWFLLRLKQGDSCINLTTSQHPEFDAWRWVSYWYPIRKITAFKRHVYRQVMREFAAVLMPLRTRWRQRP